MPETLHSQATECHVCPTQRIIAFVAQAQTQRDGSHCRQASPAGAMPFSLHLPAFRTKGATWVLLTQLGSNTLQHFEASKRLRSKKFSYPRCVPCTALLSTYQRSWRQLLLKQSRVPCCFAALLRTGPRFYKPLRVLCASKPSLPFMCHSQAWFSLATLGWRRKDLLITKML